MPSDSGDALGEPEAKKLEFESASPRVESVTAGGVHSPSGKENSEGPTGLPLTVSGCTAKNDPKMSEDKLKEHQESITKTKLDQKAEKKADKKAGQDAAKNEKGEKKPRMTAKAKSNPKGKAKAAAPKKDADEETDTLDSEEPLTEHSDLEDESEPGEAKDKVGVLQIYDDCIISNWILLYLKDLNGISCTNRFS